MLELSPGRLADHSLKLIEPVDPRSNTVFIVRRFHSMIRRLSRNKIGGEGLAIFRFLYAIVLMCEIAHFIIYRELKFDPIPFLEPFELDFLPVFLVWELVVFMLMIGAFTRTVTIINYVLNLVFFSTIQSFEYHMTYVYTGINFLLMFVDVSKCYSFDRLWLKLKYSNTKNIYEPPRTVSQLHYIAIQFVALGLVYFDSTFYKLASPLWLNGLGLWLPASMPNHIVNDLTPLLNQKWLVLALGYLTFAFELSFIFLFWIRYLRIPLATIGVGLHVGILIVFYIPWFALGYIVLYATLVPVSLWEKLRNSFRSRDSKTTFFYDGECPLRLRKRIILESLDVRKVIRFRTVQEADPEEEGLGGIPPEQLFEHPYSVDRQGEVREGYLAYAQLFREMVFLYPLSVFMRLPIASFLGQRIYGRIVSNRNGKRYTEEDSGYPTLSFPNASSSEVRLFSNFRLGDLKTAAWSIFLVSAVLFQMNAIFSSPIGAKITGNRIRTNAFIHDNAKNILGITKHPVFLDFHFQSTLNFIGIGWEDRAGVRTWLPILDERGMLNGYAFGSNMVNWTHRTSKPDPRGKPFQTRMARWMTFWLKENGIPFSGGHFNIYKKWTHYPRGWEKDFLKKQIAKRWVNIAPATDVAP
jgi:predicted DCC family thiol-disulfide oxidoreductase YuxK